MFEGSGPRAHFLERVRGAAVGEAPRRDVGAEGPGHEAGRSALVGTLAEDFKANAGKAGIVVAAVDSRAAVVDAVSEILSRHSVRAAYMWSDRSLDRYGLGALAGPAGVILLSCDADEPEEARKADAFQMECGITSVDYAIAETGSLVLASGPGRARSVSLLGDVHIAIVERTALLPDLYDLPSRLASDHPSQLPSNVTVITGPSKTADIELQIVVGVHGPRHVYAVLVEAD